MKANELMIKDVMCGDWIDVRNDAAPNKSHYSDAWNRKRDNNLT